MADFEFKINQAALDKLERDLAERFSAGVQVPLNGTEADAIRSVTEQLEAMGATPDEAAVEKVVREARQS